MRGWSLEYEGASQQVLTVDVNGRWSASEEVSGGFELRLDVDADAWRIGENRVEFCNVDILSVPGQVPNLGPVNICTGLAIDPPPSVIPEPLNSRDTFHPGSIAGCSLSKGQGGMEWFLILGFLVLLRYKYSQQTKYDH
jgi:hypothetical protein